MRGCTITTFIIALLAITLAAAAPQPKKKSKSIAIPLTKRNSLALLHLNNTVNFAAVDAHVASVSAKIIRGLDNYEENMGTTHPSVLERRRPQKRDGGLALTKYKNLMWHGVLSIGTPQKEFVVELDTGSADLFVLRNDAAMLQPENSAWNPSLSSTVDDLNHPFRIMFGNGDLVTGKQYVDNVTVAGFTADKQTIGAATTFVFMGSYNTRPVDGILGLAFQSISTYPATTLLETLISENKLTDPMFSLWLTPSGGELFIGGTNEALYQKDTLAYAPVTEKGYWQIWADVIQANGQTIAKNMGVVIDTGSNFIFGDWFQVTKLHEVLGGRRIIGSDYFSFPCHADPEPSVTFILGGRPVKIPLEILRLGPISEGSSDCMSGIVPQIAAVSFWTIGGPFLQTVYTVFDYGTGPQASPRVGFAQLAQ